VRCLPPPRRIEWSHERQRCCYLEHLRLTSRFSSRFQLPVVSSAPLAWSQTDIDVALVRTRRNRVATLRTDVEALSNTLHLKLQEVLAPRPSADAPAGASSSAPPPPAEPAQPPAPPAAAPSAAPAAESPAGAPPSPPRTPLPVPFAQVDAVHADSPAAAAGLATGDLLVALGSVTMEGNSAASALGALPATLAAAVDAARTLPVVVLRRAAAVAPAAAGAAGNGEATAAAAAAAATPAADGDVDAGRLERVELVLRPASWGGRGVLGCHVVPVRVTETGFRPQVATAVARHGQGE